MPPHQLLSRSASTGTTTSTTMTMLERTSPQPPPPPPRSGTLRHVPPAPSSYGNNNNNNMSTLNRRPKTTMSSLPDSAPIVTRRTMQRNGSMRDIPHQHSPVPPPLRSRTYSGNSLHRSESSSSAPGSPTGSETPSQLRRRQTLRLDDGDVRQLKRDVSIGSSQGNLQQNGNAMLSPSVVPPTYHVPTTNSNRRRQQQNQKGDAAFTLTHLIQSLIVFTIFYLVYDAHHKVQMAQLRLEQYREEERMLVAQMDRIEQRAMQLQEQLKKLREDHLEAKFAGIPQYKLPTAVEAIAVHKAESAHLQEEISSVKRQSQVVDSEVRGLQDFLQQQARKSLSKKYGQGKSIQLTMGLGWKKTTTKNNNNHAEHNKPFEIIMEFFEETPYATYILLEQIDVGDWKGAKFTKHPNHYIMAEPLPKQKGDAPMLQMEFIEPSYYAHKAWTVGLTPMSNNKNGSGSTSNKSYSLYINLMDNTKRHRGDICLGKIVGGFDALQELMHIEAKEEQQFRMSKSIEITSLTVASTRQSKIRTS